MWGKLYTMPYTPPVYPTAIPTQTGETPDLPDRIDDLDWLYAARYNELKKELCAALTELGTNPKGSYSDVKTRLNDLDDVFLTIDQSVTPQVTVGRFTFPYVDTKLGKTDGVYFEVQEFSALGVTFPILVADNDGFTGQGAIKNNLIIGGVDGDPVLIFVNDDITKLSAITYYTALDEIRFGTVFGKSDITAGDGIIPAMMYRHYPFLGASDVGDGHSFYWINRRKTSGLPGADFYAASIKERVEDADETTYGASLEFSTSKGGTTNLLALRLYGKDATLYGDVTINGDLTLTDGDIILETGYIDSKLGYKVDGTDPAADDTYENPTSITIKGGIITAIS